MIELEKIPGIALQLFIWRLTDIKNDVAVLSKKLKYQENDSFRIGLKNPTLNAINYTLMFLTTNLNKIGMKATSVSFSSNGDGAKMNQMKLNIGREENENDGTIQLFTAPLQLIAGASCNFIFTVNLSHIVGNYNVQ